MPDTPSVLSLVNAIINLVTIYLVRLAITEARTAARVSKKTAVEIGAIEKDESS